MTAAHAAAAQIPCPHCGAEAGVVCTIDGFRRRIPCVERSRRAPPPMPDFPDITQPRHPKEIDS